jgi:hypothetical protein
MDTQPAVGDNEKHFGLCDIRNLAESNAFATDSIQFQTVKANQSDGGL